MSAPTAEHLFDEHNIDHVDRYLDPLSALAGSLGVLALASWAAAIATHLIHVNATNIGAVVIAVGLAAVVTVCAVICWCASAIRAHNRRIATVVCARIDAMGDLHGRRHPDQVGVPRPDVDSELRAYLAGRIERDE